MKRLIFVLVLIALLAGAGFGLHQISRARCFALAGPLVCRVDTVRPEVAITFDDGPTQEGLDAILPVLAAHRARATFFVIGEQTARRPDLARRILAGGHELGNHTWSHQRMLLRSQGFYRRELRQTERLLNRLRGPDGSAGLFRPPYGKKLAGLGLAVGAEDLTMVTWDIEEPTTTDPAAYAREVVEQARPGSIIVIHAMYEANGVGRAALPLILDGLERKGLRSVTVGRLITRAEPG